jgi:hypothetical protein
MTRAQPPTASGRTNIVQLSALSRSDGQASPAPTSTPTADDRGIPHVPARRDLHALLCYDQAYANLLRCVNPILSPPAGGSDSPTPTLGSARFDPITRWTYMNEMMAHFADLHPREVSPFSCSLPNRRVFQNVLSNIWRVVHDGDRDALVRLHGALIEGDRSPADSDI